MVKVTCRAELTEIKEDGFTLAIHPDGKMYVRHVCSGKFTNEMKGFDPESACLLFSEVLKRRCMDCGDISLPDDLAAIFYLYNFDSIQRGDRS